MALEEYIKQVKETWTSYTLDLVIYQNKTRLIRFVAYSEPEIFETDSPAEDGTTCLLSAART